MVKHGTNKKRRSGRTGKTKLKNRTWKRFDPKPKIDSALKEHWDARKTPSANLANLGLLAHPNGNCTTAAPPKPSNVSTNAIELYTVPDSDVPSRKTRFPLTKEEEVYIAKCMEKHGDDYTRMFRDIRVNKMQHTEDKLSKMGTRFLLLSPDQRQVDVPERVKGLLQEETSD